MSNHVGPALILCLMISGCDQLPGNQAQEQRLTNVEEKLTKLENGIDKLQKQVSDLEQTRQLDELFRNSDRLAYLTPGAEGYSTVRFDLGVLTVELTDVKPYANGSRVTLRFGNTLSSSINGLKATIEWGKVDDKGFPLGDRLKSKDMTFAKTIRAGAWTPISVVLDGVPPKELGFVRVSKVTHTGIQLFK